MSDSGNNSLKVFDDDAGVANDLLLVDNMNLGGFSDGSGSYSWVPGANRMVAFNFTGTGSDHQLTTIDADGGSRVDIATMDNSLNFQISGDGSRIAIADRNVAGLEARLFFVSTDSSTVEHSFDFTTDTLNLTLTEIQLVDRQ